MTGIRGPCRASFHFEGEMDYAHRMTARNQLNGTVEEIQLGGVMAHVVVRVGENSSKA
jgi:hypothetical protein